MADRLCRRTCHAGVTACLLAVAAILTGAATARADTTHPFLGHLHLDTTSQVQPVGVDSAGNLYVWMIASHELAKFDANGNPVNFTGLGTNLIDGKGSSNCPVVAADCDQVPLNGFDGSVNGGFGISAATPAVVDTSGGPANGYIYIANSFFTGASSVGEVDVFDATGKFRGTINQNLATPSSSPTDPATTISLSPKGTLFIAHGSHADAYAPVDGNPADDQFAGQLRSDAGGTTFTSGGIGYVLGDDQYAYTHTYASLTQLEGMTSYWKKFPISELQRPTGDSIPSDFSPDQSRSGNESGPFGDGGVDEFCGGCGFQNASLDPRTHHIYLLPLQSGGIEEWDADNHRVGPRFGEPDQIVGGAKSLAFDHSGGTHDGDIYVQGAGGPGDVAVFGPPTIIPDIVYRAVENGHTDARIDATVDPAGGGPITDCHVEYGLSISYGESTPCIDGPGANDVSVDLSGLITEATYHYRMVASNGTALSRGDDQTFRTPAVLKLSTDPATAIDQHNATLNGRLDPDGLETAYHFDYGVDTSYRQSTATEDAGSGSGQSAVTPASIGGLQPGRVYHYRLVATNNLGTTLGSDRSFRTASAPAISGVHATDVDDSSAVLHALINPFGYDTTYHFEYGITLAYGTSAPAGDADAGSATTDQTVSVPIDGLQSGVVYHFRVVSTNSWGTTTSSDGTFSFLPPTCPNAHVRGLTGSSYLPDCRAYELVSPGNAGAVTLFPGGISTTLGQGSGGTFFSNPNLAIEAPNASGLAINPPRFGFMAAIGQVNGTDAPNSIIDRYVATRTATGWMTTYPGITADQTVVQGRPRCDVALDTCIDYRLGDPGFGGGKLDPNPYVWDVNGNSLGRWPTNMDVVPNIGNYEHGFDISGDQQPSADFGHYIFSSRDVAFASGGLTSAPGSAYDNDIKNRTVSVVSVLSDGTPIPQDQGNSSEFIKITAVSRDGSHILMSTVGPSGATHLYMRVDDSITYDVGHGNPVKFVGMSSDGSRVIFISPLQLTSDDTDNSLDMFVWDEGSDKITRISQGDGNGDSNDCNATWSFGCGVASFATERPDLDNKIAPESGDPYFFSPEQLDPNNPGVANERNLYAYHDGKVKYVTTLDPGTEIDRMQISPDGSHAAFLTAARLTGYDNKGWREMYTYDANTGEIRCASCLPDGDPPTILHADPPASTLGDDSGDVLASQSGPFMSNDGRVAFATSDALVPQDTDGTIDVYEFVDSRAQLISAGTGSRDFSPGALFFPALYTGLESFSANGADIYFSTYDTLIPQDHNGNFVKFYDARTNGGFIPPQATLPCVAADECHGAGSEAPGEPQIGTGAWLGSGGNQRSASVNSRHGHAHRRHRRHRGRSKRRGVHHRNKGRMR